VTVVFLHGVPETSAIWDGVRAQLGRRSIALALPGFGCPRPEGFGATKEEYTAWLVGELEQLEQPVDLVGHDWGALLTLRVATAHSGVVRSWAADMPAHFHNEYEWHPLAVEWQTPGRGESYLEAARQLPDAPRVRWLDAQSTEEAATIIAALDETAYGCILDLYRSAVPNLHADWGAEAGRPTLAPGLVLLLGSVTEDFRRLDLDVAQQLGARTTSLDGLGHDWMLEDPAAGAAALTRFWRGLAAPPP
jgi:pimeloyl-ACP methyl ester carboxylesterase